MYLQVKMELSYFPLPPPPISRFEIHLLQPVEWDLVTCAPSSVLGTKLLETVSPIVGHSMMAFLPVSLHQSVLWASPVGRCEQNGTFNSYL
jgi:hypothetical protein